MRDVVVLNREGRFKRAEFVVTLFLGVKLDDSKSCHLVMVMVAMKAN